MDKSWLIRSKSKQILGPVPTVKIQELLTQKKLKDEDEICSGNGYWIFVKEKELVQKYVHEGLPQGFNPISEASSVLGGTDKQTAVFTLANLRGHIKEGGEEIPEDKVHLPRSEDLEYPEMSRTKTATAPQTDAGQYPSAADLEYPTPLKKK